MANLKANDWLLAQGHISEIKRGRRSAENTQRLADAHAAGTRFVDWEPVESVNASGEKVIKNVSRGSVSNIDNFNDGFIRFEGGDDNWVVREIGTNKVRSLKEVCRGCGNSLIGHTCLDAQPEIVSTNARGGVRVTITRK